MRKPAASARTTIITRIIKPVSKTATTSPISPTSTPGLRVYDIRDARQPKEIAYFVPADPQDPHRHQADPTRRAIRRRARRPAWLHLLKRQEPRHSRSATEKGLVVCQEKVIEGMNLRVVNLRHVVILRSFATKNLHHEPPTPTARLFHGTKADPSPPAQDDSEETIGVRLIDWRERTLAPRTRCQTTLLENPTASSTLGNTSTAPRR